jgi:hypothetical protein
MIKGWPEPTVVIATIVEVKATGHINAPKRIPNVEGSQLKLVARSG